MLYFDKFKDKEFTVINYSRSDSKYPVWSLNSFGYERDLRNKWWNIQPGDVVVDIGAGAGSYTLTALVSGAAKVIAIEPGEEEFFTLYSNLLLNRFLTNCILLPFVVTDSIREEASIIDFYPMNHNGKYDSKVPERRLATTLDTLVNSFVIDKVDWIKIDVEGAEVKVLKGADTLLKTYHPKLLLENHLGLNPKIREEIGEILLPLGYREEDNYCKKEDSNENWSLWSKL